MAEDSLFERAEAASSEAQRLIKINREYQHRVREGIREMRLKVIFEPRNMKVSYPQDVSPVRKSNWGGC
jgi:hypothetical protein